MSPINWVDWEIMLLLSRFSERNREIALKRWSYYSETQPILADLGDVYGISRERVRQIVNKIERRLREDDQELESGSEVLEIIDKYGGILPTQELLNRLKDGGTSASDGAIRVISSLCEAGVVPGNLRYSDDFAVWVTEKGEPHLSESGKLASIRRDLRDRALRYLRTIGAIPLSGMRDGAPFTPEHAVEMAIADRGPFEAVLNHLVPQTPYDSQLSRRSEKMLAVADELPLSTVVGGLSRSLDADLPPPAVIRTILEKHGSCQLLGRNVRPGSDHPGLECLSGADKEAMAIFRENDGIMLSTEFATAMVEAGFSDPMASVIRRSAPYLANPAFSVYTLRGAKIKQQEIRRYIERWRDDRGEYLLSLRRISPSAILARFRVNSVAANGVLNVPSEVETGTEDWTARLPDGRSVSLTLRNSFLWSLRDWVDEENVKVGDIIVATFRSDRQVVELDLIRSE